MLVPSATSLGCARRAPWCQGAAGDPGEITLCPALGEDVHLLKTQLFCILGEIPWLSGKGQFRKGPVPAWVAGTQWHCDSRLESCVGLVRGAHSAFKADAFKTGLLESSGLEPGLRGRSGCPWRVVVSVGCLRFPYTVPNPRAHFWPQGMGLVVEQDLEKMCGAPAAKGGGR